MQPGWEGAHQCRKPLPLQGQTLDGLIFSRSGCPENLITNNVLVVTTFRRPVGWGALREGPQCRHWGRGGAACRVGRKGQGKDRALQ